MGLTGPDVNSDVTINLGWNVLVNLFSRWIEKQRRDPKTGEAVERKSMKGVPVVKMEADPAVRRRRSH